MAPKKKKVVDELVQIEELIEPKSEEVEPDPEPILYTITLEGRHGMIDGAVNGVPFRLPRGVEMQVDEPTYHAVKAHIIKER